MFDAYYVIPRGSSIPEVVKSSGVGRTGNENQRDFRIGHRQDSNLLSV